MTRARDLGIPFDGDPGPFNAITDVAGVCVGHTTLISGEGPLRVGEGPIRTGVTVVLPRGSLTNPVFAGHYSLNGNGEMTGTIWIEESGLLEGPIGLTNTHSVGVVRDAIIAWQVRRSGGGRNGVVRPGISWSLPVVAETYDGLLNDINGQHVKEEHVFAALESAQGGAVQEGSVGGGTGMRCFCYKGGIGTASRVVQTPQGDYVLGALVQANFGRAGELTIGGVPVGRHLPWPANPTESPSSGAGSIIVIVATDAPLLPHQLKRLARRVPLGLARLGGAGEHGSGDIFIAFSTANPDAGQLRGVQQLQALASDAMTPLFDATIQSSEEAIANALVTAQTMTGINGNTAYALPHEGLHDVLRQYGRLAETG